MCVYVFETLCVYVCVYMHVCIDSRLCEYEWAFMGGLYPKKALHVIYKEQITNPFGRYRKPANIVMCCLGKAK